MNLRGDGREIHDELVPVASSLAEWRLRGQVLEIVYDPNCVVLELLQQLVPHPLHRDGLVLLRQFYESHVPLPQKILHLWGLDPKVDSLSVVPEPLEHVLRLLDVDGDFLR